MFLALKNNPHIIAIYSELLIIIRHVKYLEIFPPV